MNFPDILLTLFFLQNPLCTQFLDMRQHIQILIIQIILSSAKIHFSDLIRLARHVIFVDQIMAILAFQLGFDHSKFFLQIPHIGFGFFDKFVICVDFIEIWDHLLFQFLIPHFAPMVEGLFIRHWGHLGLLLGQKWFFDLILDSRLLNNLFR